MAWQFTMANRILLRITWEHVCVSENTQPRMEPHTHTHTYLEAGIRRQVQAEEAGVGHGKHLVAGLHARGQGGEEVDRERLRPVAVVGREAIPAPNEPGRTHTHTHDGGGGCA